MPRGTPEGAQPDDELLEAIQRLGRLMSSRQVSMRIAERGPGRDVSRQGLHLLRSLLRSGEVPVARLATVADMDIAVVSRQLRLLEGAGLSVAGPAEPGDGRVALVSLTSSGARLARRIREVGLRHLAHSLADWPPDDRQEPRGASCCTDSSTISNAPRSSAAGAEPGGRTVSRRVAYTPHEPPDDHAEIGRIGQVHAEGLQHADPQLHRPEGDQNGPNFEVGIDLATILPEPVDVAPLVELGGVVLAEARADLVVAAGGHRSLEQQGAELSPVRVVAEDEGVDVRDLGDALGWLLDELVEDLHVDGGQQQSRLAAEVAVDRTAGQPGPVGEVVDRHRRVALLGEHRRGQGDQPLSCRHGIVHRPHRTGGAERICATHHQLT